MAALALPSFLGSPDDATKVIDAYSETSSELRTALSSKVSSFTSGLGGIFDKTVGIAKGVGEKLRSNTVDLAEAARRVQGALKGSRSDILSLAGSTEKLIMGELTGVEGSTNYVRTATDVARGLEIMVGDGKQLIDTFKSGGYGQVSAVVSFISDLTDTPGLKMFDLGAEAAILRGVVEEVSSWGIPSLVDDVFKTSSPSVKYAVIKRSAETISYTASLDTLLAYANVVGDQKYDAEGNPVGLPPNIGVNALNAATPTFAQLFLQNYTMNIGLTPDKYPAEVTKLLTLLDRLQPNWMWINRNDKRIWNLGVINTASEHAVKLFLSSDVTRDIMLTAPFYHAMKAQDVINQMYPEVALGE